VSAAISIGIADPAWNNGFHYWFERTTISLAAINLVSDSACTTGQGSWGGRVGRLAMIAGI